MSEIEAMVDNLVASCIDYGRFDGTNSLDNLQFLSWFENRCKNDMSQEEWEVLKSNIQEYFI